MTGHHSVATVMGYFRAESALGSKVSRMLARHRQVARELSYLRSARLIGIPTAVEWAQIDPLAR